ncbi:MAG: FHA domain-containing protein [Planctomycetes bacterium]|nr:FHA domain-containing protein [Planctomycetota bacterium]
MPVARLVVLDAPAQGLAVEVGPRPVVIGRNPDCALRIETSSVSKHHCEVKIVDGRFVVRDLGSRNGTLVNGKKITEGPLAPGDQLKVGKISIRFEGPEGAPRASRSPAAAVAPPSPPPPRSGGAREGDTTSGEPPTEPAPRRTGGGDTGRRKAGGTRRTSRPTRHVVVVDRPTARTAEIPPPLAPDPLRDLAGDTDDDDDGSLKTEQAPFPALYAESIPTAPLPATAALLAEGLTGAGSSGGLPASASAALRRELVDQPALERVIDRLVSLLEFGEFYGHSRRVRQFALLIADAMHMEANQQKCLALAATLHDIGNLKVPAPVLRKSDELSPEERALVEQHTVVGAEIVRTMDLPESVVAAVRSHHERFDGKGYPDRLQGGDIPYLGRLLAVAESAVGMSSDRPHRPRKDPAAIIVMMTRGMGSLYDPAIVPIALEVLKSPKLIS